MPAFYSSFHQHLPNSQSEVCGFIDNPHWESSSSKVLAAYDSGSQPFGD